MARLLVVEDERSIRQALCFELEDEGYEVYAASGYSEALSILNALPFDCIISDVFLENGNGALLMNHIRKNYRALPFIGITANPDAELAVQLKSVLKDRFFVKPFLFPQLKKKIGEVLKLKMYGMDRLPQPVF